jgi:hypothetical protein
MRDTTKIQGATQPGRYSLHDDPVMDRLEALLRKMPPNRREIIMDALNHNTTVTPHLWCTDIAGG